MVRKTRVFKARDTAKRHQLNACGQQVQHFVGDDLAGRAASHIEVMRQNQPALLVSAFKSMIMRHALNASLLATPLIIQMLKNKINRTNLSIGLIFVAVSLLLSQHWGMLLSNSDDPWIVRSTWREILDAASAQGRFWLIPINFIAGLPYKLGGWSGLFITKIVVNALTLLAFVVFLKKLINLPFALLTATVWLALLEISHGYYSAFHGFLLMFNLQMGVLFLSLWWYMILREKKNTGMQFLGPYALFGFVLLAYEPMLFLALTFPAVALLKDLALHQLTFTQHNTSGKVLRLLTWTRAWAQQNWLIFLVLALYVFAYFVYRHFQPTPGRGLDPVGDPAEIIRTIYRFSVYGFNVEFSPLKTLNSEDASFSLIARVGVYALCLIGAAYLMIPELDSNEGESILRHPFGLSILGFLLISPNLLHGFVEGYRKWAMESPYYVGNYLSSFALAILVTLCISSIAGGEKARQEKTLLLLIVYALGGSAADNMMRWSQLADTNRRDGQAWVRAIEALKIKLVEAQPSTINICGIRAPEKVSGDDRFWSYHLSQEMGLPITYQSKNINSATCDLRIEFNQYPDQKVP